MPRTSMSCTTLRVSFWLEMQMTASLMHIALDASQQVLLPGRSTGSQGYVFQLIDDGGSTATIGWKGKNPSSSAGNAYFIHDDNDPDSDLTLALAGTSGSGLSIDYNASYPASPAFEIKRPMSRSPRSSCLK